MYRILVCAPSSKEWPPKKEPDGRYCCTKSMVISPLCFSAEHHWIMITPSLFSTDDIRIQKCIFLNSQKQGKVYNRGGVFHVWSIVVTTQELFFFWQLDGESDQTWQILSSLSWHHATFRGQGTASNTHQQLWTRSHCMLLDSWQLSHCVFLWSVWEY